MNPEYPSSPFCQWLRVFCRHHGGQSQETQSCIIHPFQIFTAWLTRNFGPPCSRVFRSGHGGKASSS